MKNQRLAEIDPVTAWAEEVVAEKIVAGPHVRDAAKRHLRDLDEGKDRGLIWNPKEAKNKIDLFPRFLRLNGGKFEGKPFHLHPSQQFRIGSLYGWQVEGTFGIERRFRRFYDEEGKGNGKSPLLAGIGFIGLCFDDRARAEIYAAAAKKDQAMILFQDAVAMRELSPALEERVTPTGKNPVHRLNYIGKRGDKRFFRPISSDNKQSGTRPYVGLCDEIHEHRDGTTVEMIERGLAKSPINTLLGMATNSGHDRLSYCFEQHTHACRVAAGDIIDDRTFSFVCSLDHGDDWLNDPTVWGKPNPLLGVTIQPDDLAEAVNQAKAIPGMRNNIARLHFCEWTESHTIWIERSALEACEDPDFDLKEMEGRRYWDSLDLSMTRDMTGRARIFEDGQTADGKPCFALWVHGYMPESTLLNREREDQAPYSEWVRQGFLTATPGEKVNYETVARDVLKDASSGNLDFLTFDAYLAAFFKDELDKLGADLPLYEHPQGWTKRKSSPLFMPDSIALIEQLIAERRLRIHVNPAFRAAMMAVAFRRSPLDLRRFEKAKAQARIDLAVAATQAVGAALVFSEGEREVEYQAGQMFG